VLASATGGDITLTFTKAPRYVHVTSGGGDITIVVPPGNYLFNATAYGGSASAPASDPGATDVVTATAVSARLRRISGRCRRGRRTRSPAREPHPGSAARAPRTAPVLAHGAPG